MDIKAAREMRRKAETEIQLILVNLATNTDCDVIGLDVDFAEVTRFGSDRKRFAPIEIRIKLESP